MSQALCFNDVQFDVIHQNSQPWVRGSQIATALQYASVQRIIELYTRHAEEFTDTMTAVVTLPTKGGPQETRIFSLRGCHLLAMFARTPVAKAFRKWVLDVLDRLAAEERAALPEVPHIKITLSTTASRKPLEKLLKVWAAQSGIIVAQCWTMVNSAFNLQSITELPEEWIPDAIAWVQGKIDEQRKALPPYPGSNPEQSRPIPAPSTALPFRSDFPTDMSDGCKDALGKIQRLTWGVHAALDVVKMFCNPKWNADAQNNAPHDIAINLFRSAEANLVAAYNDLEAGYKLGRLHGRG